MDSILISFELISLCMSMLIIIANLRTPVIVKEGTTLELSSVLRYYRENGFFLDLTGILPLNIILGMLSYLTNLGYMGLENPIILISLLRITRIVSAWKILHIFGTLEVYLKQSHVLIHILKAVLFLYLLWHWTACLWFFLNLYLEKGEKNTWMNYNELQEEGLGKRFLLSFYCVMNVVSSVGYGDMFPVNDLERLFFIFLINLADALFAAAFGLIAAITMQSSSSNINVHYIRLNKVREILAQHDVDGSLKDRVEQYFAYAWHISKRSDMVSYSKLKQMLPYRLAQDIVYYSTRDLLFPMFQRFNSMNLIHDVSYALRPMIFMPGDFIINKVSGARD